MHFFHGSAPSITDREFLHLHLQGARFAEEIIFFTENNPCFAFQAQIFECVSHPETNRRNR